MLSLSNADFDLLKEASDNGVFAHEPSFCFLRMCQTLGREGITSLARKPVFRPYFRSFHLADLAERFPESVNVNNTVFWQELLIEHELWKVFEGKELSLFKFLTKLPTFIDVLLIEKGLALSLSRKFFLTLGVSVERVMKEIRQDGTWSDFVKDPVSLRYALKFHPGMARCLLEGGKFELIQTPQDLIDITGVVCLFPPSENPSDFLEKMFKKGIFQRIFNTPDEQADFLAQVPEQFREFLRGVFVNGPSPCQASTPFLSVVTVKTPKTPDSDSGARPS